MGKLTLAMHNESLALREENAQLRRALTQQKQSYEREIAFEVSAERDRLASRVDGLTAQLREAEARYMALLKAVADGAAMQPSTIVMGLGPNTEFSGGPAGL